MYFFKFYRFFFLKHPVYTMTDRKVFSFRFACLIATPTCLKIKLISNDGLFEVFKYLKNFNELGIFSPTEESEGECN